MIKLKSFASATKLFVSLGGKYFKNKMINKLSFMSVCLCTIFQYEVNGIHILFYRDLNGTDQWGFRNIGPGCNRLHITEPITVTRSVETDWCVILYQGAHGTSCKATEAPGGSDFITQNVSAGFSTISPTHITGFRSCIVDSRELTQLDIGIAIPYEHKRLYKNNSKNPEYKIVKTYQDVCTCVNTFENEKHLKEYAIFAYSQDYVAYFEPDCKETQLEATIVERRHFWFSSRAFITKYEVLNTTQPIKSFGPLAYSLYFKNNCNMELKFLDLQKNNYQLEQKFLQSARFFNESLTSMIVIQQKQNVKIRKLDEKYNGTEAKLESYQNSIVDQLTELRNEIDDNKGHFRDD